jgi:hypothetical protein
MDWLGRARISFLLIAEGVIKVGIAPNKSVTISQTTNSLHRNVDIY